MKHVKLFEGFLQKEEELNELFGIGKLASALFKKMSNDISIPIKNKIADIQKTIDAKTGEIKVKDLSKQLTASLEVITKDAEEKIDKAEDSKGFVSLMKEFINNIKSVFIAAKVPLEGMVSDPTKYVRRGGWGISGTNEGLEFRLNEGYLGDLDEDFIALLKIEDPAKYEKALDEFAVDFAEKKGQKSAFSDDMLIK